MLNRGTDATRTPFSLHTLTHGLHYGFFPAVFLTPFSLQLVAFCCNLQLLQSWSVKQSTEREMKSFSCLPETHCAHKQSSLPFKISQNLFKPRKSTQKNTHIQKLLLSQGLSFMAVSKSWDLKQHPVKPLKYIFPWIQVFFDYTVKKTQRILNF